LGHGGRLKAIIGRALNAALVLICHFGLVVILIISFHLGERLINYLGGTQGEQVFGQLPLAYLFQALDVAMIALFGVMGLREAYKVLK
jgi:hypothetical protein